MTAAEVCGDDPVTEMGGLDGELQHFYGIYPLVMSTVCYWKWPSRNRWFTELNSMVDLSIAM